VILSEKRTTIFLGNFGSGKTEVSVNFAIYIANRRKDFSVTIIDLDLVNPYFRSREPRLIMEKYGIRVVIPQTQYLYADLPILVPEVRTVLVASTSILVLDVGGDDLGARVLAALKDALLPQDYRALMVVNASRPFTSDVDGIIKMKREIEAAGGVFITGFVSNTHLMEETTIDTIVKGYELINRAAKEAGVNFEFVTAPQKIEKEAREIFGDEVLPIKRYLAPSWETKVDGKKGKELFKL